LFELHEKDYKGWAKGLRKAGYATDPKYPSKLISLIERYDLHNYDDLSSSLKINKNDTVSKNIYTVNKGDTLYSVSRKFNISVSELMKLNALSGNNLSIGQQLIVK
jgi:LysM repeat protein